MEERETRGAVGIGLIWGCIGGVFGFCVSLLGSLAGMVAAVFVGMSVGRRAAAAEGERRGGARAGFVGGAVAAPAVVVGASAGALVSAQAVDVTRISVELSGMLGAPVTPDETWRLIVLVVALAAVFQAMLVVGVSTAAGAWAMRKRAS